MDSIFKKLDQISDLMKAALMPSLRMPGHVAGKVKAPKAPSAAPAGKKNPLKVAEQVKTPEAKDFAIRAATQQLQANTPRITSVVKTEESQRFHLFQNGQRLTNEPMSLDEVHKRHGGVKNLERSGVVLVESKPVSLSQHPKTGQWSLKSRS